MPGQTPHCNGPVTHLVAGPWPVSLPAQGLTVLAGEVSVALFIEQGLCICPGRWSPRVLLHYLSRFVLVFFFLGEGLPKLCH